jgi:predicted transcriptional regulator
MRTSTWLVTLGAVVAVVASQAAAAQTATPAAATPAAATHLNSQQEMMKSCAADAKTRGLKGDDRKSFMSTCLSSKGMSKEDINKQQEKMKTCNADATSKHLKGDERKAFMKTCLSG